ncbi:MAG: TlpA family protein disulfide reductase, partial [Planctomycetota bacterium]
WEDAIQFVGVIPGPDENVDEEEVRRLAKSFRLPYPQARDRDLSLTRRFGVRGTPTIIVLGPGGVVRYRGHSLPADLEALATAGAQGLVEPLR